MDDAGESAGRFFSHLCESDRRQQHARRMDKEMGPLVSGWIIDTNILIYHLAGVLTDQAEATLAGALESGSYISIITRIELLGWQKHSPDSLKAAEGPQTCFDFVQIFVYDRSPNILFVHAWE